MAMNACPSLLADVVDGADVGMVQCGSGLGFALEARERLRVAGNVFRQELQGDEAVEPSVLGLVDHTHAAAAELLDDAVVAQVLVDNRRMADFVSAIGKDTPSPHPVSKS